MNLFLSVGPPGPGGYHPIRTIFQAVGLYDELHLSLAPETRITSDWSGLPPVNTLSRTWNLLQELLPLPPMHIHLVKRIPSEAGLGGGSSDAAGLIRGALHFTGAAVSQEFRDVASAIGADVPFFLVGGRARGEGIGEVLTPLPDAPPETFLIVKPGEGVVTRDAYAALDRLESRSWRPFPTSGDESYNDFERVAPCICGELAAALVAAGARSALLSGSGSAVFGRFPDSASARSAESRIQTEFGLPTWVAPSLTRNESCRVERG